MNEIVKAKNVNSVSAIIPNSIEDMYRVAKMVVVGGIAPKAIVHKKSQDEAISAVCTAIMSGAELGLPPMVSLRSFTVINGMPALYGDGLINVCRRSGLAEYIKTGYDEETKSGWCHAKRLDTKEEKKVFFSEDDAKRAGLWDARETVKRQDWNTKQWKDVPNDSPWFRYTKRMQMWRASGYCLRELFADVLGGVPTEDEVIEISQKEQPKSIIASPPPNLELTDVSIDPPNETPEEVFKRAENWFSNCTDREDIEVAWDEFSHLQETFSADDFSHLVSLYEQHLARIRTAGDEANMPAGQLEDAIQP